MNGHGIIGDQKHGNRKFNELIKSEFNTSRMMLHAIHIEFIHPVTKETLSLETKIPDNFIRIQ